MEDEIQRLKEEKKEREENDKVAKDTLQETQRQLTLAQEALARKKKEHQKELEAKISELDQLNESHVELKNLFASYKAKAQLQETSAGGETTENGGKEDSGASLGESMLLSEYKGLKQDNSLLRSEVEMLRRDLFRLESTNKKLIEKDSETRALMKERYETESREKDLLILEQEKMIEGYCKYF